jgi:DNA-binding transcriptional LysR family regulator
MELRHLKSFLAVADTLNFTRAATLLHLSQPALTAHVQQLEAELGIQLFLRNRRSVALTPAGESLHRDAASILHLLRDAELRAQRISRGEAGHLRIGFVASAAIDLVPSIVLAFRRQYPQVTLELMNVRSSDQITQLEDGRLDAGFLRLPIPHKLLHITPIHKEPFVLAAPPGHPLATMPEFHPRDAQSAEFLAYARRWAPGFFDLWSGIFERAGFTPHIIQETGEMSTLLALVSAGAGVAVVPRGLAAGSGQKIVMRALPPRSPLSEIGFAIRAADSNPLLARLRKIAQAMGRKTSEGNAKA